MPILDCRCPACGETFEYLKLAPADEPACPGCGSRKVERLLSTFAVAAGGHRSVPRCGDKAAGCPNYGPQCLHQGE